MTLGCCCTAGAAAHAAAAAAAAGGAAANAAAVRMYCCMVPLLSWWKKCIPRLRVALYKSEGMWLNIVLPSANTPLVATTGMCAFRLLWNPGMMAYTRKHAETLSVAVKKGRA